AQGVLGTVAVWIPSIHGRHRPRIGRDERRERQTAMTILATACRDRRNHGMPQPPKYAFALAAVIHGVFPEGFRQSVARRRRYRRNGKIRTESLPECSGPV